VIEGDNAVEVARRFLMFHQVCGGVVWVP